MRIGISGWTYAPWRGVFYPKDLPHRSEAELAYASRRFRTIEINGSFYSLQRPESYEKWCRQVPDDFVFSVKANRFITHIRRLIEIEKPLANFMASGLLSLGHKLGPILWQFPATLRFDPERFRRFVDLLPDDTARAAALARRHERWMNGRSRVSAGSSRSLRHAVEVRSPSFQDERFYEMLRERGIDLVISHSSGKWPIYEELTADFVYVRLHGQGELYSGGYGTRALKAWERKIREWTTGRARRDVYVYFDNDAKVRAPFDAIELERSLSEPLRKVA